MELPSNISLHPSTAVHVKPIDEPEEMEAEVP